MAALIQLTQINGLSSRFSHLERRGVNPHYLENAEVELSLIAFDGAPFTSSSDMNG